MRHQALPTLPLDRARKLKLERYGLTGPPDQEHLFLTFNGALDGYRWLTGGRRIRTERSSEPGDEPPAAA